MLNKIDKALWDVQPEDYPNTIRWNAGHVYITAEDFLHDADCNYTVTKPEWLKLFIDGTSPMDWRNKEVPSSEEIMLALKEQEERINIYFQVKLKQQASIARDVNGMLLETVDSSLQFVTWHEGIHLGFMNGLNKLFQSDSSIQELVRSR